MHKRTESRNTKEIRHAKKEIRNLTDGWKHMKLSSFFFKMMFVSAYLEATEILSTAESTETIMTI